MSWSYCPLTQHRSLQVRQVGVVHQYTVLQLEVSSSKVPVCSEPIYWTDSHYIIHYTHHVEGYFTKPKTNHAHFLSEFICPNITQKMLS